MDCVRRRGKVYCAVISVPEDLQLQIGKKQIWRSLKTKTYSVARSLSRKLLVAADQLFMQMRSNMDSRTINALVAEFGLDLLKCNDEIRQGTIEAPPHSSEAEINWLELAKIIYARGSQSEAGRVMLELLAMNKVSDIEKLIFANKPGDLRFVSNAFELFLDKQGIDHPPLESKDEKQLMTAMAQTARLAFIIERERVHGIRDESELQHRLVTKWNADLPVVKDPGMPISELLDKYYAVWSKKFRTKENVNEYRLNRKSRDHEIIKDSMLELFGADIGIKEINDDKAEEWRDFHQSENKLRNTSMNKYLEHLNSAFIWAVNRQRKYAEFNPLEKKRLPKGVSREKSREFSTDELQQYVDLLADTYPPENPEHAWIPLLILYQGMRNNEIAQLFVEDIQEQDGIMFFRICDSAARKQRVKVHVSHRDLPIHSQLIELGFMRYVQKVREAGHEQLFPNCSYNKRTGRYYDDNLSARLNTVVDCISNDRRLRVYSLRSNFKTVIENKFTNAAIDVMEGKGSSLDIVGLEKFVERAFNDVMGHAAKGGTGSVTYRKVKLRIMKRIVEQAEYTLDIKKMKTVLLENNK
jgi:integrase